MDKILGILLGESYSGIHALADLSMCVKIYQQLPKRFSARNSDMILVPTVGLCRASIFVPLNEQGMVVEGERI